MVFNHGPPPFHHHCTKARTRRLGARHVHEAQVKIHSSPKCELSCMKARNLMGVGVDNLEEAQVKLAGRLHPQDMRLLHISKSDG